MATKKITKKEVAKKTDFKKLKTSISPNTLLHKPHITEKSARANEKNNVYTFLVHKDSNKTEIAKAIINLYGVKPLAVNVMNIKPEQVVKRGKAGVVKGYRKALVTLAKGDVISFTA